jgi:hypothetical protein
LNSKPWRYMDKWRYCSTHASPLTYGAEPFLRSRQLYSHSRTPQYFMDLKGSLQCPQEPPTGPYSEPHQSNSHHPILSLQDPSYIVRPSTSRSSQLSLSFWLSHQYPICIPLLSHSCYMPYPSYTPWCDHSNYATSEIDTSGRSAVGRDCFCPRQATPDAPWIWGFVGLRPGLFVRPIMISNILLSNLWPNKCYRLWDFPITILYELLFLSRATHPTFLILHALINSVRLYGEFAIGWIDWEKKGSSRYYR